MMKSYLPPLRLRNGLRTGVDCHRKIRLQWKKEINIHKDLIVKGNRRINEKRKEIRQLFSKAVMSLYAAELVNWLLNIARSWSPYGVVLFILTLSLVGWRTSADLDVQENNKNQNVDNNLDESDSEADVDTGNSLQTSMPANTKKTYVGWFDCTKTYRK